MGLKRVLGAVDAGWLVAGNMIGAGIFITPGLVAGHLPGAAWPLTAWVIGGLLALCGAAVYGELGARIPRAGGDYQYLASAFGPLWGFLTGWAALILSFSAAAAVMSRVALSYLESAVPFLEGTPRGLVPIGAPLIILALTLANTAGARVAGKTTAFLTAIPLVGLVALFGFGVFAGQTEAHWPTDTVALPAGAWPLAFGAALVPIFFTYSGWNAAAYMAGEMKNPGRNLARGLLIGTGLVTSLYLLVNLGLIAVLPQDVLAGSTRPAAEAAERLIGFRGERVLALMIAVAITGSANVTLMAGARIYYAMAVDGLAPSPLARTNRFGVPSTALWVGGVWSAVLAIIGDVGELVNWATLAILLLSSLTVASLFVFRRRDPRGSPFRCPGYPLTPLLYLLTSLGIAIVSGISDPRHSIIGILMVAVGIPIYPVARRWFRKVDVLER